MIKSLLNVSPSLDEGVTHESSLQHILLNYFLQKGNVSVKDAEMLAEAYVEALLEQGDKK